MHEPNILLTRVIGYSIVVGLVLLMLWPFSASSGVVAVYQSRGDRVTLTDEPCNSEVKLKIKPEWQSKFRASTYYVGQTKITVRGCYMLYEDNYQMIFEDGDIFALPKHLFDGSKI
jgi:hypothetical protein